MTNLYMLRVALGYVSIPLRPHSDNNYITIFKKCQYIYHCMLPYPIEPHNPWSKTPRQKTLLELIEEEELFARILVEQQSSQQNQTVSTATGAGGVPTYEYFNPPISSDFSYTPSSATITWDDTNGNNQTGTLSEFNATADKNTVTRIAISNQSLTELTLGSQLTSLTNLDCSTNQLSSLDVSNCPLISIINCSNNELVTINGVTNNTTLTQFRCFLNTPLTSLDVSGCTALRVLDCSACSLTTLNITGCSSLLFLVTHSNHLTTIDVSISSVLFYVEAGTNDFNQTTVDYILTTLDSGGVESGVVTLLNTAIPSATGQTAATNLSNKSWTVEIDS